MNLYKNIVIIKCHESLREHNSVGIDNALLYVGLRFEHRTPHLTTLKSEL